jgi:hypothetical protein
MSNAEGIKWLKDVEAHDFEAAYNYLSIRLGDDAKKLVHKLEGTKITTRRANDILRASNREPLPLSDPGVLRDLKKAVAGKKLSPVLVVEIDGVGEIADGYHRVSLAYQLDPFADIPLRLV